MKYKSNTLKQKNKVDKNNSNKQTSMKPQKKTKVGNILFNIAAFVLVAYVAYQYILPRFISKDQPDNKTNEVVAANIMENGDMVIALEDIHEEAIFHSYEHEGAHVEVLAVLASDGTVRTAFNTCQVCYSSGRGYYIQEGDYLVCQNCKNMFHRDMVEKAKGGCNPVPIFDEDITVTDSEIIIPAQYLSEASQLFANWSRG